MIPAVVYGGGKDEPVPIQVRPQDPDRPDEEAGSENAIFLLTLAGAARSATP